MKLLVIVLCLFSERFFVHVSSHHRFNWFSAYGKAVEQRLSRVSFLSSPWTILTLMLLPIFLIFAVVYGFCSNALFGLVGLVLNIVVFYYCIGPRNPFYPVHASTTETASNENEVETYLVDVNSQLFAVLFWYIVLGPFALLLYRLVSLCRSFGVVGHKAFWLTNLLEWLPARMTALLYLLVGNFQAGFCHFSKLLLTMPLNNQALLGVCGQEALSSSEEESRVMPQAERLVEHAVILLLVFLAFFTLVAWA